ncbi:phenol hydroxylase subunit [Parazoarcus communis]|uniref:Phenol hydroxylase n=1 Tax=Parazoarcus communis SWub3 = DSM 12120 TaxID=1121029 RepID=A0A323UWP8_9RHOO|nr:phenol hydroxylase subunit [Parazoarcus communis]NMG69116.1 phenol hydroxylase [Parazoarcus communis SWub3 = DSM 12120]PZA16969.1 phenol hydroxylase [Azoarcus communis] [Parazoarcus communis SWub3 = DSM 12120]
MRVESARMDTTRRFVRICGERGNGFIEFEFAIGEPEVFVEMILTREALTEFCAANRVEMLPPRDPDTPQGDWDWRLADATHTRFRQAQ